MHSALITRHFRDFHSEETRHYRSYSVPVVPKVVDTTHIPIPLTLEDAFASHLRIIRKQRIGLSFTMLDENYSTVLEYLGHAFKRRASLRASDVAEALGMDYGTVREIIAKLIDEGKLKAK